MSLITPKSLPVKSLRSWVLEQLRLEGEPLRWAITSIDPSSEGSTTALEVEVVLIDA